jgi:predicted DCC family thiol-disulfide oxidoreductase YuxK
VRERPSNLHKRQKIPPIGQVFCGWILYDDSCGFCRRWIPFWENALRRRGFNIASLHADSVRAKLQMSESDLLRDLRLLLADGSQICGADVIESLRRSLRVLSWIAICYLPAAFFSRMTEYIL